MRYYQNPYHFISHNVERFLFELSAFIKIPSISADPKNKNDVKNCAQWLASHVDEIGLENIAVIATKKHPIVYADWRHAPGKPTLLIYGHYDVQPVDPVNQWKLPPFSGAVANGYLHGRGSSDDKGQMFTHLKALQWFLHTEKKIPINVKCVFEGEEEIGSPGLQNVIRQTPEFLKADAAVISDMAIPTPDQPAITNTLRGALTFELEVATQKSDLHSGSFGGAVYNAAYLLCKIIEGIQGNDGKITIQGFYDDVLSIGPSRPDHINSYGRPDRKIINDAGAVCSWNEKGYSLYESITARPSFSVNGITAVIRVGDLKLLYRQRLLQKSVSGWYPNKTPNKLKGFCIIMFNPSHHGAFKFH